MNGFILFMQVIINKIAFFRKFVGIWYLVRTYLGHLYLFYKILINKIKIPIVIITIIIIEILMQQVILKILYKKSKKNMNL